MEETKKRTARKAFVMEYEEIEKKETLQNFRRVRQADVLLKIRKRCVLQRLLRQTFRTGTRGSTEGWRYGCYAARRRPRYGR